MYAATQPRSPYSGPLPFKTPAHEYLLDLSFCPLDFLVAPKSLITYPLHRSSHTHHFASHALFSGHLRVTSSTGFPVFKMLLKAAVAGAILSSTGVDAFWRMECPHRLGLGRVDPLTNFGTVSQHAHAIYGSNGKFLFFFLWGHGLARFSSLGHVHRLNVL